MKTHLEFANLAGIETEVLVVVAGDAQTDKGGKPELALLTHDAAVKAAASAALASGEFKGGANECLLLHAPAGLAAKRLLLVGVGKAAKATAHSVRTAVGTAIRFVKPRGVRNVAFALPAAENLPPGPCSRAAVEGAMCWRITIRILIVSDRKDLSVYDFTLAPVAGEAAASVELGICRRQHYCREPELCSGAGE